MNPPSPRARRWRRRLMQLAIALVLGRLLLALLLPWLLGLAAGSAGLALDCRAAHLSLLGLSLRLDDVVVRDAATPDAPPLLVAQEVFADASTWQLLHGDIVVVDAALAGVRLHVVRGPDGQLRLPSAWQQPAPATAPAAEEPAPPLRLEAPLQVVSVRLHDVRVELEDLGAGTTTTCTLDADLADFGRSDRACTFELRGHGPQLFDDVWLRGDLTLHDGRAALQWQAGLRGVRPASLPWLDGPTDVPSQHVVALSAEGSLQATSPPTGRLPGLTSEVALRVRLDERDQLVTTLRAGPSQVDGAAWQLPIVLRLHGDELVDELRIAADVRVAEQVTRCTGNMRGQGATLRLLAPWLASLGVAMPSSGMALRADLAADASDGHVDVELAQVALGVDSTELTLPRLTVRGLRTVGVALHIDAIELDGPQLAVARDATGALELLGAQLTPPPAAPPAPSAAAAPAEPFAWPQLTVGRVAWSGARIAFTDRSLATPAALQIDVAVQGERLTLGQDAPPGRLSADLRVANAVDALRLDATLTPTSATLGVDGKLDAREITAAALAPWLAPAGITPQLQHGSLRALLTAELRAAPGAVEIDAKVANVRFEDGGELLLGLRHVDGRGCRAGAAFDLGSWTVDEPYAAVHRGADGTLRALGLQFGPAAPPAAPAGTAPPAPTAATPHSAPIEIHHGEIELRAAVLRWIDDSRSPPLELALGSDARIGAGGANGAPTAFAVDVRVEPAIGRLAVRGSVQRDADSGSVRAELTGAQWRGAGLQALLPPHVTCMLEDGQLRGQLQVDWRLRPAPAVDVALTGFAIDDRGAELLALDELELQLPEITAERLHVARARVRGLRGVAAATADGLHALGLQIAAAATPTPTPPPPTTPPTAPAAGSPLLLPALQIDELDLQLERFVWRQRGATDGEPLVASVRLALAEPWATAAAAEDTPPCRLLATAAVPPLCRNVEMKLDLAPFALAPTLDLALHASGIDTTAIDRVAPSLQGKVTGTCSEATFATKVHGRLDLRRRDPRRFDFGSAFGGELVVESTDLVAVDGDTTLLHVDEIDVALRAFDPHTGDVLLRSIDVDGPRVVVERSAAGLTLLGVRVPLDVAGDPGTEPAKATTPPDPSGEFAVDRLQVLGVDLTFTDHSTEPPTVLPIRDTDLKVQNLSTRALSEPRTIAFQAAIHGGDVQLERRVLRSSVFAGLLGSAAEALAGVPDQHEMESRPLVDEIDISGQLQPWPRPIGDVRLAVSQFELPAVRGLAKATGVDIGDGVFDLEVQTQLRGAEGIQLRARPVFTWLSLSEPPGGPLSTYLKLPAPLDTVLFVLKNEDDEHVLPLQIEVPTEGLSGGAIAGAAAEALGHLIADAVSSAAFRVGGMVTGAVGLGGTDSAAKLTATLDFAAGDPLPPRGSLADLIAAVADDPSLTIVLQHELGGGDLQRAGELACPPAEVVRAAATRLGAERVRLERERALLAGNTAALYGGGRLQDAWQQQQRLHDLDQRLGALVVTQEETLRVLAGESERAARRRTRAGAEALAAARLNAVRQQLQRALGDSVATRIVLRSPRGVVTAGLPAGGRVVASVRRRPQG